MKIYRMICFSFTKFYFPWIRMKIIFIFKISTRITCKFLYLVYQNMRRNSIRERSSCENILRLHRGTFFQFQSMFGCIPDLIWPSLRLPKGSTIQMTCSRENFIQLLLKINYPFIQKKKEYKSINRNDERY